MISPRQLVRQPTAPHGFRFYHMKPANECEAPRFRDRETEPLMFQKAPAYPSRSTYPTLVTAYASNASSTLMIGTLSACA
jgi:hypothetical protein